MKGLAKSEFIDAINKRYTSDTALILQDEIEELMATYGADYYYSRDNARFEPARRNNGDSKTI